MKEISFFFKSTSITEVSFNIISTLVLFVTLINSYIKTKAVIIVIIILNIWKIQGPKLITTQPTTNSIKSKQKEDNICHRSLNNHISIIKTYQLILSITINNKTQQVKINCSVILITKKNL